MQVSRGTHRLLLYIQDQRQLGKSDDEIRTMLTSDGHSKADIDRLFGILERGSAAEYQVVDSHESFVADPPDNGLQSFGVGVGIVVAITLITYIVLRFTTDWSVVFWGLSIVGIFWAGKGIFLGLSCPDGGRAKAGRSVLYVLGIGVIGACAFWTWTTFYASPPSESEVVWSESSAEPVNNRLGLNRHQLTGTIQNNASDWRLTNLELAVTPLNGSGDPVGGDPIKRAIAPQGVGPGGTVSYSETVTFPGTAEGYEEFLSWDWVRD